jgi:RNA polymerase sigma-32 factor
MELGMRLKKSNDLEAAKTLILSHLKLVVKVAKGYSGYGLPQSDLVQEGNIGLMKAVKRFDPERGVRLVSFAIYWIKAEIQEYIVKNWRLVKTATTKAQRKLFFNLRSMKKTLQPLKTDEINSIAKELNVKPEDVREMEYRFNGNEISLDYGSEESEDDVFRPIAYLKDETPEPSEKMEIDQSEGNSLSSLSKALSSLDKRSRLILEERWLKDKDASTLHELADKLGVSAERIRQIEQAAMKKIKLLMLSSSH